MSTTICAIATAPGGALGIVRISGPEAITIADKVFRPIGKNTTPLAQRKAATATFGQVSTATGDVVDEVLATIFRAPHSYTGEDTVELSCHGSAYILRQVTRLLIENGCQPAEPGEYTKRAYLNGRMDLSQAEAVADLIAAKSERAHNVALRQMRGSMRDKLAQLRARLLRLTALAELELDFSDHEELEFAPRGELLELAHEAQLTIKTMADSFATGNAIRHGVGVAIVGQPNAGKSTLLNALVGDDRAIVSDTPGTTRDAIEDSIDIDGIDFRLIDTAGLRHTDDSVERMGIERTYDRMARADIVVWVVDATKARQQTAQLADDIAAHCHGKRLIVALNKADIAEKDSLNGKSAEPSTIVDDAVRGLQNLPSDAAIISMAAKTGRGLDQLRRALVDATGINGLDADTAIVTSARHYAALTHALEAMNRVADGLQTSLPTDLVCQDLREAIGHLAEITGQAITADDALSLIFSEFCIGK